MKSPRPLLKGLAVAGAAIVVMAAPAQADIVLEFDDLIFGAEGSVRTVGEAAVPADLVGQRCQISVIAENQASVHPGNDLIVSTGGSQAVVVGVEDEVNGGTIETYQVVVGPSIVVQLRFGADEMSSLGFGLSFDCDQEAPTTVDPNLDGQQVGGPASSTPPSTATTASPTAGVSGSCGDGGPSSGPTDSSGPSGPTESTTTSGAAATGEATTCPDPASAETPTEVTSTTTSVPPPTVAPTTAASTASARAALPPSPVASAIVAAPAYAG